MSSSSTRGSDDPAEIMADIPELELGPTDDQGSSSSDDETIRGDRSEDHIADADPPEQERQSSVSPEPTIRASSIKNRYRELVEADAAHETASENGSSDAGIPRMAASPQGSTTSIPDDSPSVQVCYSASAYSRRCQRD